MAARCQQPTSSRSVAKTGTATDHGVRPSNRYLDTPAWSNDVAVTIALNSLSISG
jgi:hypothetical protein